ncbi:hypothetical protein [Weissella koreensis]|uniref:Uncharacterized protein n=1 Tax=Weissella koreensis TaxID=165096 RepID=A0A7H1MLU2_9LACO|nr:hypothetical protein [Weissella koreensis]AVH75224.1 hypothetical protein C4597_03915 [Weissella koreensis]QGN20449.1 hypothetical protein GKC51_03895 [Weissella koreensis]QNT64428.1 hypothetical protein FY536_03620 [Weissella koreensis]
MKETKNIVFTTAELSEMIIEMEKKLGVPSVFQEVDTLIKSKISSTSFNQLKKNFGVINRKKLNLKTNGIPASLYYLIALITMNSLEADRKVSNNDDPEYQDLGGLVELLKGTHILEYSEDKKADVNKMASALRNNSIKYISNLINGSNILNFYYKFINEFPIPDSLNDNIKINSEKESRIIQLKYLNFVHLIFLYPDLLNYQSLTGPSFIYRDLPLSIKSAILFCDLDKYPVNWPSHYEGATQIKKAFAYIRNHEPLGIMCKITIKHLPNFKNRNSKTTTKLSEIFNQLQFKDKNDNLSDILYKSNFNDFILNNYHNPSLSYKDIAELITTIIPATHKATNISNLKDEYPGTITIKNPENIINLMPKNISKELDDYIFKNFDVSYGNSINPETVPFSPLDIWAHSDSYKDIINIRGKYNLERFINLSNSLNDNESIEKLFYLLRIVSPNDLANVVNAISLDKLKNSHDSKDAFTLLKEIK